VQSQVRFNRVSEKVPEKVRAALVQSPVSFNRLPEKLPEHVPEKVWEALLQSQVRLNMSPKKVPEKVLWCRARAGATGFRRNFLKRFQEALVQTQVRFNGVRRRLQSRSRRRFWESLVQAQVRTGFPALGFTRTLQKDL
jgi:hypothetical protein